MVCTLTHCTHWIVIMCNAPFSCSTSLTFTLDFRVVARLLPISFPFSTTSTILWYYYFYLPPIFLHTCGNCLDDRIIFIVVLNYCVMHTYYDGETDLHQRPHPFLFLFDMLIDTNGPPLISIWHIWLRPIFLVIACSRS